MAVSAGQHQRPLEIQLVEQAINEAARNGSLGAYVQALKTGSETPTAPWVNAALTRPDHIDAPKWNSAQNKATESWFGANGAKPQWVQSEQAQPDFSWPAMEVATSRALEKIAEHRMTLEDDIQIEIACTFSNTIDVVLTEGQPTCTITVPYSRFSFAVMQEKHLGLSESSEDIDVADRIINGSDTRPTTTLARTSRPLTWNPIEPTSLLNDVQANILAAHRLPHSRIAFVALDDHRARLRDLGTRLTTALEQDGSASCINVLVTPAVLDRLGMDRLGVDGLRPDATPLIHFPGAPSGPAAEAHAMIVVAADTPSTADEILDALVKSEGVSELHREIGATSPTKAEPFGFRDGISDPAILLHTALARRKHRQPSRWSDVFSVEQLLRPDGDSAMSYCVYLKLQQNVDAWKSVPNPENRVGRQEDGFLAKDSPRATAGLPPSASPPDVDNDFDYEPGTIEATSIPETAHIRAVNPRDARGRQWAFARRGMPYESDGSAGLLFLGFMASITDQFVPMITHALDTKDALLTGSHAGTPFVKAVDGGYFVAMPKSFFKSL